MKQCPHCDTRLPDEMTFCPYCMQKLAAEQPVTAPSPVKRTGLLWVATAAVIVLLLCGALLLSDYGRQLPPVDNGDAGTTGSTTTTTTTVYQGVVPPAGGGATSGSTTTTTDTDTEEPQPTDVQGGDAGCTHDWKPIIQTVEHEEIGHYEDVATGYNMVTIYKCAVCYRQFNSLEEYYTHFDEHIATSDQLVVAFRERYETDTKKVTVYTQKWVVDQPAYSDEQIIGYRCSKCRAEAA